MPGIQIPNSIPLHVGTPGERAFHSFLKSVFQSSGDARAWYNVLVNRRRADFALFFPQVGLFAVEVKDWGLSNIRQVGPDYWEVDIGDKDPGKKNPYCQAQEYSNCFMTALRGFDFAPLGSPSHLLFPVNPLVAFTNISREEGRKRLNLSEAEFGSTLFKEDFGTDSLYRDKREGAEAFSRFLSKSRRIGFEPGKLNAGQLDVLNTQIFQSAYDSFRVVRPKLKETRLIGDVELDDFQLRYARDLPDGPRLIKGMAGSGKSIVLAQRAIFKASHSSKKRVLLTCYNLSLANNLREMVYRKLPDELQENVVVLPFFDLCSEILGEKIRDTGNSAYYEATINRAIGAAETLSDDRKFDVVLIDEGQDFSAEMARVAIAMLRRGSLDVMGAIDESQDLYGWGGIRQAGVEFTVHSLPSAYRCTQEIFDFAHKISGRPDPPSIDSETGSMLDVPLGKRSGAVPDLYSFDDIDRLVGDVVEKVLRLHEEEIPWAEIGILYTSRRLPKPPSLTSSEKKSSPTLGFGALAVLKTASQCEIDIPQRILTEFKSSGDPPVTFVAQDGQSKRAFKLQEDSIKLCTVHSAKGLDFKAVILVDAGEPLKDGSLDSKNDFKTQATACTANLLFVGCTRARDLLHVWKVAIP